MTTSSGSKNSSLRTQQFEISFVTSNKGKPLLIYENYLFKCDKTTSKKHWLCIEYECSVYIHTIITDEFICITDNHNHFANLDQLAAKLLRDKMKKTNISWNNVHYKNI